MNSSEMPWGAQNDGPHPAEITDIDRRLNFLAIDEHDRQRLHQLAELLQVHSAEFVEVFYRHLFAFPETARFLQDKALVERLKLAQQRHLESMLEANWDEDYVSKRYRVGDVHAQVGISPQIFLGAYNQYLQFCHRQLTKQVDGPARAMAEYILSLQKAVFLDIGLTLEAYFTQATHNLRQALDLVYRANRDLRQFAHLTSHDLKTPLATMANLCDEAVDEFGDQMPPEAVKLITSARERAFRMSATIDELLHSTMSLHDEADLHVVVSDEVLHETVEQLRPLLEQKSIRLTVAPGLPKVQGDRARLREVFYNLLNNAIKFSDKVDSHIQVGYIPGDGVCTFTFADNGSGIPPDELTRIFVPFRRLTAHRNVPGSGLGLYFAKTMVEQQQGRIWVESELGRGSTFFVQLRLARTPAN